MKKSVQALIKRRRARIIPVILAALAGLVLLALVLMVFSFFTSGPGLALFQPRRRHRPRSPRRPH